MLINKFVFGQVLPKLPSFWQNPCIPDQVFAEWGKILAIFFSKFNETLENTVPFPTKKLWGVFYLWKILGKTTAGEKLRAINFASILQLTTQQRIPWLTGVQPTADRVLSVWTDDKWLKPPETTTGTKMSSQLAEATRPQQSHFFNFFGGGSNFFKTVLIDKFHCQLIIFFERKPPFLKKIRLWGVWDGRFSGELARMKIGVTECNFEHF